MHSYMIYISNLKASLAFKSRLAFYIEIHVIGIPRSRLAGETPARSGTCIPTEKVRRDLNASDSVFLTFSDDENYLSIGSMVQR